MTRQDNDNTVIPALLDLVKQINERNCNLEQSPFIRTWGGENYLEYGVGRRLLQLSYILKVFFNRIPPDREKPLSNDESEELNPLLNMFYIDLYGLLDNAGWILAYEIGMLTDSFEEDTLKPKIGLFNKDTQKELRKHESSSALLERVHSLDEWFNELRDRRHPSAHRIPLYFIPAELSYKEMQIYKEKYIEHIMYCGQEKFDSADDSWSTLESLGKFSSEFGHDAIHQYPIYPTIIDDCKNSLSIVDEVIHFLRNRLE